MVMRRQLALLYTLAAEEIQDLSILCVHKYRSANLSALLQNTEESTVIYMKRRAVVGHKNLDAGNASPRKFFDLIKDTVHNICYHGMQCKINTRLILRPHIDSIINGIQQSAIWILRSKVHNGGRAAYNSRVGRLISGGVTVADITQGGKVSVLVYASRKHIFTFGVYHTICSFVQMCPHCADHIALHQDIPHILLFCGYDCASFNQGTHTVIS